MSGGACKAVICTSQARAAAGTIQGFINDGLATADQEAEAIAISETAIHDYVALAESIDANGDDDD